MDVTKSVCTLSFPWKGWAFLQKEKLSDAWVLQNDTNRLTTLLLRKFEDVALCLFCGIFFV